MHLHYYDLDLKLKIKTSVPFSESFLRASAMSNMEFLALHPSTKY